MFKNSLTSAALALLFVLTATTQTIVQAAEETAGRPKVALALGGGGTRGAAHVGVLRVLKQEGIPIDMIAGTSMGSIVGGLYCAGVSVDTLESEFKISAIMKNYMTVPIYVRMLAIPIFAVPHLFGWHPYDGFYFGNKLRNYLDRSLPENQKEIEKLNIRYCAVATNLVDGKEFVISKGPLAWAMQASSAIPVLRRPVPLEDGLLVDGAIVANVPAKAARAMGANIVIAVDVDEKLHQIPRDHFRKIGSVAPRIEQITLAHGDDPQLQSADIVIHPNVDGIGVLSLSPSDAMAAIRAGEEAARAALPEIRAKLHMGEPAASSK